MSQLRVGAGKVCIDPTRDMLPMGTRFGICEDLYDSCYVRAIAVDNGVQKTLIITYELSDQPTVPGLTAAISEATGVPEENIVIAVTHNHSSPCDDHFGEEDPAITAGREKYKLIELETGVEVAKQAMASLRPAKYGFGESRSNINTNRDLETPFGYWVEGRNPDGFSDKTLAIVKFVDDEGKLIAALLNHPTHATNIYLMRDFDGKIKLSGNFTGIACKFVEEHYGEGAICMWTSGAAGNQNPILSHGMQYEYPDGYSTAVPYPDGVGYMQMECIGRTHGADAVRGIDAIDRYSLHMPIRHFDHDVQLVRQKRAEIGGTNGMKKKDAGQVIYSGLREEPFTPPVLPVLPEMVEDPENPIPMRMQLLMLGNIAIVCAGCEMYAEIGVRMKEESPYRNTMIITHTKDYRHVGYLVDKTSVHHKCFQALGPVKPGVCEDIVLEGQYKLFEMALEM